MSDVNEREREAETGASSTTRLAESTESQPRRVPPARGSALSVLWWTDEAGADDEQPEADAAGEQAARQTG